MDSEPVRVSPELGHPASSWPLSYSSEVGSVKIGGDPQVVEVDGLERVQTLVGGGNDHETFASLGSSFVTHRGGLSSVPVITSANQQNVRSWRMRNDFMKSEDDSTHSRNTRCWDPFNIALNVAGCGNHCLAKIWSNVLITGLGCGILFQLSWLWRAYYGGDTYTRTYTTQEKQQGVALAVTEILRDIFSMLAIRYGRLAPADTWCICRQHWQPFFAFVCIVSLVITSGGVYFRGVHHLLDAPYPTPFLKLLFFTCRPAELLGMSSAGIAATLTVCWCRVARRHIRDFGAHLEQAALTEAGLYSEAVVVYYHLRRACLGLLSSVGTATNCFIIAAGMQVWGHVLFLWFMRKWETNKFILLDCSPAILWLWLLWETSAVHCQWYPIEKHITEQLQHLAIGSTRKSSLVELRLCIACDSSGWFLLESIVVRRWWFVTVAGAVGLKMASNAAVALFPR